MKATTSILFKKTDLFSPRTYFRHPASKNLVLRNHKRKNPSSQFSTTVTKKFSQEDLIGLIMFQNIKCLE
eukprot:snap_masked-scaffold_6-processed-gene-14.14-mRNA-1 protein AED:1.00 eAED:1.00 QI:0/0/0/0/1/1/2/0/69